jgi:hypothetical protein
LKESIFLDCFNYQEESGGTKPYWNGLFEKYKSEGYETKEQLRSAYKREKKIRIKAGDVPDPNFAEKTSYEQGKDFINIVCSSRRMLSKEDLIDEFEIDLNVWEIEKYTIKSSEGYRKDRKVTWKVRDGRVSHGDVEDSGKMLVVPLYHLQIRLKPREYRFTEDIIDELFSSLKQKEFSPSRIEATQHDENGITSIIPLADLHYGLVATEEVEGEEYNIDIATRRVEGIISQAKRRLLNMKVKKIIFVVGNDFFNSDNLSATTTRGTPQDSAYSWFHMIDSALGLLVRCVDSLREISNVEVINVQSNHDLHTNYSVVKMLEQYFKSCDDVSFDNRPMYTKYLMVGQTLFGLTHDIPKKRALENITSDKDSKKYWSQAKQAVWILAHLHNATQYETQGIMEMYRLPAICNRSRWTTEKHFSRSEPRTQMFIVDDEYGILSVENIFVE